jgi:hypothetical protein
MSAVHFDAATWRHANAGGTIEIEKGARHAVKHERLVREEVETKAPQMRHPTPSRFSCIICRAIMSIVEGIADATRDNVLHPKGELFVAETRNTIFS